MKHNGIRHIQCAHNHPSSNGLAERAVQTFKEAMRKTEEDLEIRINRILSQYRSIPHATTAQPPAQLLMGRRPRTLLDLLVPDITTQVHRSQERQKTAHDQGVKPRSFLMGDAVYVKYFRVPAKWIPGVIMAQAGPLSYSVRLDTGV